MAAHTKLTTELHALKRRVAEALYADDERATMHAVAEFLDVNPRSVRRWVAAYRVQGDEGLLAQPTSGRPPKLTSTQEKIIRRWLADKPTDHGFATDLWTGPRVAQMIRRELAIELNPKYLTVWLRRRGFTPQKPQRVPRQRDPEVIAAWLETQWPRIKKNYGGKA